MTSKKKSRKVPSKFWIALFIGYSRESRDVRNDTRKKIGLFRFLRRIVKILYTLFEDSCDSMYIGYGDSIKNTCYSLLIDRSDFLKWLVWFLCESKAKYSLVMRVYLSYDKSMFFKKFKLFRHIWLGAISSCKEITRGIYSCGYKREDSIGFYSKPYGREDKIPRIFEEGGEFKKIIDEKLFLAHLRGFFVR